MFFALLTAHVITDFALQPDWMASHKKRSFWVLLLHAAVTGLGALVAIWLYHPNLWEGAVSLFVMHLAVDWTKIRIDAWRRNGGLATFLADQLLHVLSIVAMLAVVSAVTGETCANLLQVRVEHQSSALTYAFAYCTSIFFGYVLIKVLCLGLPTDGQANRGRVVKYMGMLERGLITTCVAVGHSVLIIVIITPCFLYRDRLAEGLEARHRLGLETLINVALATSAGLLLRL